MFPEIKRRPYVDATIEATGRVVRNMVTPTMISGWTIFFFFRLLNLKVQH